MILPRSIVSSGVVALTPLLGSAQPNTFVFEVSNTVTPENPSATVSLWAAFDPKWYAWAHSELDVVTAPDAGWLSDPHVEFFQWWVSFPGEVGAGGDSVAGLYLIQYHFLLGQQADTSNPLLLWSATWTTDDFTPREVPIWTESLSYFVYISDSGQWYDFHGEDFAEGSGLITVIPGPAIAALLTLGGAFVLPRRRPAPRTPCASSPATRPATTPTA